MAKNHHFLFSLIYRSEQNYLVFNKSSIGGNLTKQPCAGSKRTTFVSMKSNLMDPLVKHSSLFLTSLQLGLRLFFVVK